MERNQTHDAIKRGYGGKLEGCQFTFSGINNIIDPANLNLNEGEVIDAINTDFDNTNSAVRRAGSTPVFLGNYHSAWNNESKTVAYMVSNAMIYEFDGTTVPIPIISLTTNAPMEFCQVNDVVVYSNCTDFGIIGGVNNQIRLYSPEFKRQTLAGRNLEFYNGRLYFSIVNSLYCSDVFDVEHMDIRFSRVATFPHVITMCKRVEDGLWVGTEGYTYFLKGDDIQVDGFEQIIAAKNGVVYGTACKTNAEYVPSAKGEKIVVLFLTQQGMCSGAIGGNYVNHSFNKVTFPVGTTGTGTIRTSRGMSQYVTTFDIQPEYEYEPYSIDIPIEITTI